MFGKIFGVDFEGEIWVCLGRILERLFCSQCIKRLPVPVIARACKYIGFFYPHYAEKSAFFGVFDNFCCSVYDIDSQTADRVQRLVVTARFEFALV